ncbi:MAG TPA: CBS domain-containing protein [Actinomycetota bacterium]|nr:CBS domain-containing protein [Actinomycetota bacterium]
MKVRAVYQPEVLAAGPYEDLAEVACRMQFHEVGALVVFDHGLLRGIITERDLVRAVADGADPAVTPVERYMTVEPATVAPDESVSEVAALMLRLGVRHLPVTEAGRMLGMVAAQDLLSDIAWEQEVTLP